MMNEEHENMMLAYLSGLRKGQKPLRRAEDLCVMNTRELLLLAERVDDAALGLFVQMLKSTGKGGEFFERLMGDHEEENRPLVDAFFSRYLHTVLSVIEDGADYNPLAVYLPDSTFADLAFLQTRQPFFLRQSIDTINEYLDGLFGGPHQYQPGEQDVAWEYFWNKVLER